MKTRRIILVILALMLSTTIAYGSSTTTSPFTGSKYTHHSMFDSYEKYNGIDVSEWQGDINWKRIKNTGKVDFAIVRCSYSSTANGKLYTDKKYKANLKGAAAQGIPCGAYHFSQAITKKEARAEARYLLNRIKGYDVTLPVIIDFEFGPGYRLNKLQKKTKTYNTDVVSAFCKVIKDAGYTPMVYANLSDMTSSLKPTTLRNRGYELWLAQWASKASLSQLYLCWQYSSSGKLKGIPGNGNVDCNFFYDNGQFVSNRVTGLKKKSAGNKSITIKWNKKEAASSYYIYRSDAYNGKYTKIAESETNSYRDTGLVSGKQYYYRVAAHYDETATTSNKSIKLAANTYLDYSRLAKTKTALNMRTEAGTSFDKKRVLRKNTVVTVIAKTKSKGGKTWYRVRYISGKTRTTGYISGANIRVYKVMKAKSDTDIYSSSSEESTVKGTVENITPFKIIETKTVDDEIWYKGNFTIGKKTITGWVSESDVKKYGNYKSLTKVYGVRKSADSNKSITLRWNKKAAAQQYKVYRAKAYNGKYRLIATVTDNRYKDTGLVKGTTYYYKVKAGNIFEYGDNSKKKIASTNPIRVKGTVKKAVKMRKYAGKGFKIRTVLPAKAKVTIDYQTKDKYGNKWYHVKYKKRSGYVMAKYIRKGTAFSACQTVVPLKSSCLDHAPPRPCSIGLASTSSVSE